LEKFLPSGYQFLCQRSNGFVRDVCIFCRVAELQQQLDLALKEIEVMKESRQRQAEMVFLHVNSK
jgi:hypothetical protein